MADREKNILYLSYDGLTDPLGQSQILPYVLGLAQRGYSFTVISFEKTQLFKNGKLLIQSKCDHNNIKWIPLQYHKTPPIVSTLYDLGVLWFTVKALFKRNHFPIIHCRSYLTSLIGLRAKGKWGVKFIFDMRGFWADERVEGNIWNIGNPMYRLIYRYFKNQEQTLLRRADHIVTLTKAGRSIVEKWCDQTNVTVIPCCVDLALFDPALINEQLKLNLRKSLRLDNAFVLSYIGSIGTWYLLDEMLDFFMELRNVYPTSKFLIVTREDKTQIQRSLYKKGISINDVIITAAEHSEVPSLIAISDFSILFIKPSFSKSGSSPTKLAEIMAMNVPIVTNAGVGDNDLLFPEDSFVLLTNNFSRAEYQNIINKMKHVDVEGNRIRLKATEEFSLERGISLYEGIYKTLEV